MTVRGSGAAARHRRAFTALCLGVALQAWGCRFGRAPGDGLGDFPFVVSDLDAGPADLQSAREREQAAQPSAADTPGAPPARGTASGNAGASGSPSAVAPSAGEPAADSCKKRAAIAGCDPLSNTGCPSELGMQCDVDLLATTPTGACVFSAPPPDANSCLAIFPTESCPPRSTCVEGTCLKLCLCDSDCDAAERCRVPLAASGFKACQAR